MATFEIIVFAVNLGAIGLGLISLFIRPRTRASVAESGVFWFDHYEDHEIAARPSEDAKDAPIPWRPLRGRF